MLKRFRICLLLSIASVLACFAFLCVYMAFFLAVMAAKVDSVDEIQMLLS
jgi:hypothetical protein